MPTACQWQTTAGNINNLRLVRGVDIGPLPNASITDTHSSNLPLPMATIAIKYVGLNFADMFACLGLYSATPKGTFVPGLEFSGVIEAVNDLAGAPAADSSSEEFLGDSSGRGYKVGDQVFGITRFGGYTTRLHVDTRYIRRLPKGYSLEHGAALPAQALTAWYGLIELGSMGAGLALSRRSALDMIKKKKQKVALVHSGAGGTGLWCIHICRYFNVDVVATVGSPDKKKLLENMFTETSLAADGSVSSSKLVVIDRSAWDRSDPDHRKALSKALEEVYQHHNPEAVLKNGESNQPTLGFDYVFDSLLGPWFTPSFDAMRAQGRHIVLGAGSMTPPGPRVNWISLGYKYCTRSTVDPLQMMSQNKSVMAFNLIWLFDKVEEVGEYLQDVVHMIQTTKNTTVCNEPLAKKSDHGTSGALLPTVGHLYEDFGQLPEALKALQSGTTVGKVVVSTKMLQ